MFFFYFSQFGEEAPISGFESIFYKVTTDPIIDNGCKWIIGLCYGYFYMRMFCRSRLPYSIINKNNSILQGYAPIIC